MVINSVLPPAPQKIQEFILHYCVLHLLRFIPALFSISSHASLRSGMIRLQPDPNFHFYWQFQYANYSSPQYKDTGKGSLKLQIINQRSDFSFALFTGGFLNVKLKISLQSLLLCDNKICLTNSVCPQPIFGID